MSARRNAATILAGGVALALVGLLIASPASAATLPAGQRISVIEDYPLGDQMWVASPVDASLSAPGAFGSVGNASAVDVDDDGHGYATALLQDSAAGGTGPALWAADANTGVVGDPLPIVGPNEEYTVDDCPALDYTEGVILVGCFGTVEDVPLSWIGTLLIVPESDAAVLTPIVTQGLFEDPVVYWNAIATNPVDGEVWAVGEVGFATNDNNWFHVFLGAEILGPPVPSLGSTVIGADFDRGGQLWTTTVGDSSNSLLVTDPTNGQVVEGVGEFSTVGRVEPITVWGSVPLEPVLPATGPEVLPLGLGTALLFLVGGALVASNRIPRRS